MPRRLCLFAMTAGRALVEGVAGVWVTASLALLAMTAGRALVEGVAGVWIAASAAPPRNDGGVLRWRKGAAEALDCRVGFASSQ